MEMVLSVEQHTKCVGWECREKEQKHSQREHWIKCFNSKHSKHFWTEVLPCALSSPSSQKVCSQVWPETQNVHSITDQISDVLHFHSEETCGNPQLEVSDSYNAITEKCMIVSLALLLIQLTHILVCANSKNVICIHYISQQTADNLAGQELVAISWCNDAARQLVYSHIIPLT